MIASYLDDKGYTSGRKHIWMTVTYRDEECYISGRLLHSWMMSVNIFGRLLYVWTKSVTYLDDCYISEQRVLHIWTTVTYLNNECYISGRLLHIWMMSVVYLDDCYISGDICLNIIDVRWQPHLRETTDLCRANSSLSSTMNDSQYLYYLVSMNARKFKMAMRHFGPLTDPTASHACWHIHRRDIPHWKFADYSPDPDPDTSKSHLWSLISKIYHVLGEIYKELHFQLLGLCQSPCLAGLLTSCPKTCGHITESNYPKPQLTFLVMPLSDWVWSRVMLVPYVYNLAKMCPYQTMLCNLNVAYKWEPWYKL